MKPVLIIGLGNSLMGDDGVGVRAAESLAGHASADVLIGGTDLLRCIGEIEGRERVILIDAMESDVAGEITVTDEDPPEGLSSGTHTLSAPAAVRLLRQLMPQVRFTWVLAGVHLVRIGEGLSPELLAASSGIRLRLVQAGGARPPTAGPY
jgi:hydrogenase maturation protease